MRGGKHEGENAWIPLTVVCVPYDDDDDDTNNKCFEQFARICLSSPLVLRTLSRVSWISSGAIGILFVTTRLN